jgi:hypothetical protein
MVPSELIGEDSIGGLLVFLGCWSKGPYSVPDQQGDTHPTLICRGTDARTDGRTEKIYSIFRDKLLLLGEHVLYIPLDSFATKTIESCFSHAPPLSNLLAFLSSVTPACFWWLLCLKYQSAAIEGHDVILFLFFCCSVCRPKQWYGNRPTLSTQVVHPP